MNFLEYGSTADRIVGYIGVSCIIPMIVSIPFIFKVNREKTVLDINTFYVTPFVGRTKNIPVQDVIPLDEENRSDYSMKNQI